MDLRQWYHTVYFSVKNSLVPCKVAIGLAQKGQTMVYMQKGCLHLLEHPCQVLESNDDLMAPDASARRISTTVLGSNGFAANRGNNSSTISDLDEKLFPTPSGKMN